MNENPERRWFRFHLLTLLLIALVAGGLLSLNVSMRLDHAKSHYERGWPFTMYGGNSAIPMVLLWKDNPEVYWIPDPNGPGPEPIGLNGEWYIRDLLLNTATIFAVIAATAVASEFFLRRREARR